MIIITMFKQNTQLKTVSKMDSSVKSAWDNSVDTEVDDMHFIDDPIEKKATVFSEKKGDKEQKASKEDGEEEDEEDDITYYERWEDMDLPDWLLRNIYRLGYETPLPVQQPVPHMVSAGGNWLIEASTGTGKTYSFGLVALTMLITQIKKPQIVIIAPTKELVNQHYVELCKLVENTDVSIAKHIGTSTKMADGTLLYDNNTKGYISRDLGKFPKPKPGSEQIVIGTASRIRALFDKGVKVDRNIIKADTSTVQCCILDECDALISNENNRSCSTTDIEALIGEINIDTQEMYDGMFPSGCRHFWYSATVSQNQTLVMKAAVIEATSINIECMKSKNHRIHHFYVAFNSEADKLAALIEILRNCGITGSTYIFTNTSVISTTIYETLRANGFAAGVLNARMQITDRNREMENFRTGRTNILVSTNASSRGIDVTQAQFVIHYDYSIEDGHETYQHRSGRSGRGDRSGISLLFVNGNGNEKPEIVIMLEKACLINFTELSNKLFAGITL